MLVIWMHGSGPLFDAARGTPSLRRPSIALRCSSRHRSADHRFGKPAPKTGPIEESTS